MVPRRVAAPAREDGGPTAPFQHRLHQDFSSCEGESKKAFDQEDNEDDEDYNPSQAEAAQPPRKRRKLSTLSRRDRILEAKEHRPQGEVRRVAAPGRIL
ncbi:hypothetical protein DL766_008662 [Monosporascus sp. MC13-8B]|uniref:Uncharacterized protein n=1 Tax=Monosporascus cannonballus TaxID=155416 RepID=A0ABY0HJX7_9PEZI|nr:hypothetical protein DL762_000129 [Monosporascus cannonballus]RYO99302.1 hypothetical protein DL763_001581 [Monosporascus cannonballus]RYP18480.1 hypothetical protein DL766_008662 [Monosporascus sp. MC13-8B]